MTAQSDLNRPVEVLLVLPLQFFSVLLFAEMYNCSNSFRSFPHFGISSVCRCRDFANVVFSLIIGQCLSKPFKPLKHSPVLVLTYSSLFYNQKFAEISYWFRNF